MATIRIRRDIVANWESRNPVLQSGEPGYEIDTHKLKIGDGFHPWLDLEYVAFDGVTGGPIPEGDLAAHIASLTPHTVYDDGPSLFLLYENAKV